MPKHPVHYRKTSLCPPFHTCTMTAVCSRASLSMKSRKGASTSTAALPSEAAAAAAAAQAPSPPLARTSGACAVGQIWFQGVGQGGQAAAQRAPTPLLERTSGACTVGDWVSRQGQGGGGRSAPSPQRVHSVVAQTL